MFSHLFWLSVLKDTTKAPTVDFLKLDAVSRTKTAFLTPERCDDQSHPFYIGSISPWGFPYKVGFWHLIIHYYFGNVDVFSGSFEQHDNLRILVIERIIIALTRYFFCNNDNAEDSFPNYPVQRIVFQKWFCLVVDFPYFPLISVHIFFLFLR